MLYVYKILGVLEKSDGEIGGLRVSVCSAAYMGDVDVPSIVFDKETLDYLKFRLKVHSYLNVQQLPNRIQNKIRTPTGKYLDEWVKEEFNNGISK
jgi:hypothetical protein